MKRLFTSTLLGGIVLCTYACVSGKPLKKQAPHNNATYIVSYLFEHEGCKVYRFEDCGRTVYFTNCNGETAAFDSTEVSRNRIKKNLP